MFCVNFSALLWKTHYRLFFCFSLILPSRKQPNKLLTVNLSCAMCEKKKTLSVVYHTYLAAVFTSFKYDYMEVINMSLMVLFASEGHKMAPVLISVCLLTC